MRSHTVVLTALLLSVLAVLSASQAPPELREAIANGLRLCGRGRRDMESGDGR